VALAVTGDPALAARLVSRAARLRRRFDPAYWMPDQGCYAMALGPDGGQVRSVGSNDGHLLATGIVPTSRARAVARRLFEPDMFSGWGVRTLSSAHPAYNPFSYHRGSVWPVEQGTTALGFARYGLWEELHRLTEAVFDLTDVFREGRLPESVAGLPRDDAHPHPGIYPASCEPQSWSASMVIVSIQSLLGMVAMAPLRLLLIDPHLPAWLPDIRLSGVQVGEAKVDLEVWRTSEGVTKYKWKANGVRVVRQPPPQSSVGLGNRAWTALRSLI
jgi:glycogen debranching enzyme